jgi:hypothetical protein
MTTTIQTKNISTDAVVGKCDLKCIYNFTYQASGTTTATNNGKFVTLTYEQSKVAPVFFNTFQYYVQGIYIYCPSIHLFNGAVTNAEIIIEHLPVLTGDNLFVCLPVIASTQISTAGIALANIIETVASYAPSVNETTAINANVNFNLSDFVPTKKQFINYTGTAGFLGQVVVFSIIDGIPLSSSTLTTLSKIIQANAFDVAGGDLFLNPDGANTALSADGIYISCKPTGNSEEKTEVTYKNDSVNNLGVSWNNPVVHMILIVLLLLILYIFIAVGFQALLK